MFFVSEVLLTQGTGSQRNNLWPESDKKWRTIGQQNVKGQKVKVNYKTAVLSVQRTTRILCDLACRPKNTATC